MGRYRDGLNGLPAELLCNIFRLAINPDTLRRDRCRLSLVCRLWREYVEGSALLWTLISTVDGPTYVRRALEKSKGALIDLNCPAEDDEEMDLEAFLVEAFPHIACWQSLRAWVELASPSLERVLAPLTITQPPRLESLGIWTYRWDYLNAITLFGGAPAPSTLKDLSIFRIPMAIEPLSLSGLVSLDLSEVKTISTPHLFEILRSSPGLETLSLARAPGLVAIGCQASTMQPIELPKLVSLSFDWIDNRGTNCILSNIRIPNRRHVWIHTAIGGINDEAILFTSAITHILHTTIPVTDLPSLDLTVGMGSGVDCMIQFRGITLELLVDGEDQVQWVLGWLANSFGVEGAECRVRLMLDESEMDPVRLAAVPPPLVVKHLSVSACMRKRLREFLFTAMTQPPDPPASSWLLAQMESLSVEFETTESQQQLISMLRSRYEGAAQRAETELRCPMNLQSVELRGQPRTEGLVEEIRGILSEVDVFWAN